MEIIYISTALIIAAAAGILSRNRRVIEVFSISASALVFLESFIVALKVSVVGTYSPFVYLSVDSLGAIIILLITCIGLAATVYSVAYLRQETNKGIIGLTRVRQYFVLLNIFILAMILAIVANSPILAWIFIEATTLSTAFLISFYDKPSNIEGAWKYLVINSVGLLLGFFGTLLYFTAQGEGGFITWQTLLENSGQLDPAIAKIAFVFVFIGYGTKVGLAPMHTWKPDAYSKAPNPIGALLSGALLPVAFLTVMRFKNVTDNVVGLQFSQHLLIIFGALSIGVAALIVLNIKNYKRLLAYSSIENAGIMALGFGFGGLGVFAATLHMIYHSIVKGVLFFSAGNILLKYNSAKIRNVKGALQVIPITSILFIIGFLIVTGIPPFGMFLTKLQIISTGFQVYPIVSAIVLLFMALVFVGFLKHITAMFFGKKPDGIEGGESSVWLIVPQIALLIIIIILSFYIPSFLLSLINNVVLHY